jgi:hypothetical protein
MSGYAARECGYTLARNFIRDFCECAQLSGHFMPFGRDAHQGALDGRAIETAKLMVVAMRTGARYAASFDFNFFVVPTGVTE